MKRVTEGRRLDTDFAAAMAADGNNIASSAVEVTAVPCAIRIVANELVRTTLSN
ncbi:MAG TPA: hypothetical protein VKP67_26210 [Xanthobacteraceae bacterium]|nr:hypothetical protein [Xanthobacteraceae bacterium]